MSLPLVILAAGLSSRYGHLKQVDPLGPSGESIMAYNMYDAARAGFDRFIVVTRPEIETKIKEHISAIIGERFPVEYVHQTLDNIPESQLLRSDRTRPWGTGQAVICAGSCIEGPFGVANADDLYGAEAFQGLWENMRNRPSDPVLVTYRLEKTLSKYGGVNRGVCELDEAGFLSGISEFTDIRRNSAGILGKDSNGRVTSLSEDSPVSMNLWGLTRSVLSHMEEQFRVFLGENLGDTSREFFLPDAVGEQIERKSIDVGVFETQEEWMGVTFPSDREHAIGRIGRKVEEGYYSKSLATDFKQKLKQ